MTNLDHLDSIADALIAAGFKVDKPRANCEYLDVWGYETVDGVRRKCFEEISCCIFDVDGAKVSFWTTNKIYDAQDSSIEVFQGSNGLVGIADLIASLSVKPLVKRVL